MILGSIRFSFRI